MPRARRDVDRLHDEITDLFAELWQVGPRFLNRHGFRPQIDAYRTGVDPDAIRLIVDDRTLIVSGERPRPRIDGQSWLQMEIEYGPFQRAVMIPEGVDPAQAAADYAYGLLRIVMPVVEQRSGPLRVPIAVRAHE
jgi:HSP20 family molecular chaperone IbpA